MSAAPHSDRAHAQWSASATSRNCHCPGAIAMSSLCEDVEREVAAWGTACHQISERVLRSDDPSLDASRFIGMIEKSGKFEFVVDEEMANCSQVYIEYCYERVNRYNEETGEMPVSWIEHKLSLASLDPPLEAGGTGDFIIWFPKWKLLEVIDLKGGRGVTVDVVGNPQGRSYAIGAILSLPGLDVERVMVTIVQPRVGDGLPKSDEFHVADLYDWTHDLLKHMWEAKEALEAFSVIGGTKNTVLFEQWAEDWLNPGQCTFCTAKPICPALRKKALAAMPELARKWHEDVTLETVPTLSNLAKLGSAEELGHDLDGFDELEGWIKARRAYAHAQAECGEPPTGYGLVDKIGNRAWKENETRTWMLLHEKLEMGFEDAYSARELKSVAQIEKVLGKRKGELAALEGTLWEKPVRGSNLVRLDKTSRAPAKTLAERFNETVETEK
jgi:hypothetical protein